MSDYFPEPTPELMEYLRQAFMEARRQYDKRQNGLYEKFVVLRTDGRDAPGEKHYDCRYFVLDVTHDPHARAALRAYAKSCRGDGYHALADDIESLVVKTETGDF